MKTTTVKYQLPNGTKKEKVIADKLLNEFLEQLKINGIELIGTIRIEDEKKDEVTKEAYEEIDRDMIDKVIEFLNVNVTSAYGDEGEFFQIMDDIVLPILEECLSKDIINSEHLCQHIDELHAREKQSEDINFSICEVEHFINEIKYITREK